jgi:hypothetical protein
MRSTTHWSTSSPRFHSRPEEASPRTHSTSGGSSRTRPYLWRSRRSRPSLPPALPTKAPQRRGRPPAATGYGPTPATHSKSRHKAKQTNEANHYYYLLYYLQGEPDHLDHLLAGRQHQQRERRPGAADEHGGRLSRRRKRGSISPERRPGAETS